tara:strand:+ start:160 stop:687 length:528 start_codon:yes stop_codon:yes gene_type:complete
MRIKQDNVKKSLDKFARTVRKSSRANLTRKGIGDTKKLYNSLDYDLKVHKQSFFLSFMMEDYGTFKDKGVKGVKSSKKAPNSPYQFGTGTGKKGGLTKAIDKWVKRNRIQFRTKKGRFTTYKATSFLIRRSIWNTGLKTTNFFTKPFEDNFKKLPDQIVESYGLDVINFLGFTTK